MTVERLATEILHSNRTKDDTTRRVTSVFETRETTAMTSTEAHRKSQLSPVNRATSLPPSLFNTEHPSSDPALPGGTWEIEVDPTTTKHHTNIRFFDGHYLASDGNKTSFGSCISSATGARLTAISINTPNGLTAKPGEFFQWLARVTELDIDEDGILQLTTRDGQTLTAIRRRDS